MIKKTNMPFAKRHEEIIKKIKPYSKARLWLNTFVFSILTFVAGSLYLFARRGNYDLYIANKVLATTALVLIGLSFALGALCYFWNFVDTKIIYRKHLGLVGSAYAIFHITITIFFLSDIFPYPAWFSENIISFIFAVLAFIILIMMASISNQYAIHELGTKRWRALLRIGYIAFIFVIIHFTLLKYPGWIKWFTTREPLLSPLSLLEVIFGIAVIVLRITPWVSVRKRKALSSA